MSALLRCNVFTCDSAPLPGSLYCNEHKPAPSAEPSCEPLEELDWFCPHCGLLKVRIRCEADTYATNVIDQDGCCAFCGYTCCRLSELRALLSRAGLAIVPASDVPSPISDETLRHLTECAHAWEDKACLIGNVTARQLQAFCAELADLRADVPSVEERKILREMQQAKIVSGCNRGIQCCAKFGEEVRANYVCQAELARRSARKGGEA